MILNIRTGMFWRQLFSGADKASLADVWGKVKRDAESRR
jgi:hypothetical protein